MSTPERHNLVQQLHDALRDGLSYASAAQSFSPHFSDVGLSFGSQPGVARVHLHTHHATRTLGQPWLALPGSVTQQTCTPVGVTQHFPGGCLRLAFYTRNAWLVETTGLGLLRWSLSDPQLREIRTHLVNPSGGDPALMISEAYVPTGHPDDPDPHLPLAVGLRVRRGQATPTEHGLALESDATGTLMLAMTVQTLDVRPQVVLDALHRAPDSIIAAEDATADWWQTTLGTLDLAATDGAIRRTLAQAALTLGFNAAAAGSRAPGSHAPGAWGDPVIYPQRDQRPVNDVADTCFHSLALEIISPAWARENLRRLMRILRSDGKLPGYICPTWDAPQPAPPLLGWAGLRLLNLQPDDDALARELWEALVRNNEWWISHRMTRTGLVMEMAGAGDGSPPVLSAARNSELLVQCRAAALLARKLHEEESAAQQQGLAQHLAQRMRAVLYDETAHRFVDRQWDTLAPVAGVVWDGLLPVWAGVPLEYPRIRALIETHLLRDAALPATLDADAGRGYLMLELLRAQGYGQHARQLARQWLEVPWTNELAHSSLPAAVRLRLHHDLQNENSA